MKRPMFPTLVARWKAMLPEMQANDELLYSAETDEDMEVFHAEERVHLHRLRSAFLRDTVDVNGWAHVRTVSYGDLLEAMRWRAGGAA